MNIGGQQMIDQNKAGELIESINAALKIVEEKFDMSIKVGTNLDFDGASFSVFVKGLKNGVEDPIVKAFKEHACDYGLKLEDLDRVFMDEGYLMRVAGLNPKNPKNPILAVKVKTNQGYKYSVEEIIKLLKVPCQH
jgi:hypothetical protein